MDVIPLTSDVRFGAEIVNADLASMAHEESGRDHGRLRDLLHQRLVLRFRNQSLSKDDLMAIAAIFGGTGDVDPWIREHRRHNYPDERYPFIRTVSADLTDPASGRWHADRLYRPRAPDFIILYGLEVDEGAAPTDVLSMRWLWNKMSDHERDICRDLAMVHSSRPLPGLVVDPRYWVDDAAESTFCRQLVYTDPYTEDESVCVTNYHDNHIVGMSNEECAALLASVYGHVTVDDHLSHVWSEGDLLILDNHGTNHRRGRGNTRTRVLRRLQGFYDDPALRGSR